MNTQALILATALVAANLSGPQAFAADSCSDILSHGIFNTYSLSESEKVRKEFHSWLCTSEFKTHQDAMNAGIGVGIPVYGVPVKIDGTFSKEARDAWKKDQCGAEDQSLATDNARSIAISTVSTAIVDAWKFCMTPPKGLVCDMRASDEQAMITVRYVPQFDGDSAPVVNALPELSGARCSKLSLTALPVVITPGAPAPAPQPRRRGRGRHDAAPVTPPAPQQPVLSPEVLAFGSSVHVQGYTLLCTREGKEDEGHPEVRFTLNTTKGSCSPTVSPASDNPVVFEGNSTYSSDLLIQANRVIFKKGARVRIQNGSKLEIFAKKVQIENDVLINGQGAQGPQGAKGYSPPGDWTVDDRGQYNDANGDCSNNYNHGDRGRTGGQGGVGGQGATILIHANLVGNFVYDVTGGPGGPGGPAGDGRWHVWHGDRWQCPNNGSGPSGPSGPAGKLSITPPLN